jgi:galactoside O-acetyltransferase
MKILGGRFLNEAELLKLGVKSVGENVMVHETAQLVDLENIELGSNVRIDPFCILSAAGGHVRIGDWVHIASYSALFGGAGIVFKDFSGTSANVQIFSASDNYVGLSLTNATIPLKYRRVQTGEVVFERHALVGAGTVVLPGVTLGEGAAVGALSLVSRSLDPWGIYSGCPAQRRGERSKRMLVDEARLLEELGSGER